MSAIHLILCTLEPRELHELEQACIGAVEKYLDEHPDCEDDWGEMGSGGPVPSEDDVRAAYAKSGLEPDADLSARLARCRTTFRIDHPGDIEVEGGLPPSLRLVRSRRVASWVASSKTRPGLSLAICRKRA